MCCPPPSAPTARGPELSRVALLGYPNPDILFAVLPRKASFLKKSRRFLSCSRDYSPLLSRWLLKKRCDRAIQDYDQAAQFDPRNASAYFRPGQRRRDHRGKMDM